MNTTEIMFEISYKVSNVNKIVEKIRGSKCLPQREMQNKILAVFGGSSGSAATCVTTIHRKLKTKRPYTPYNCISLELCFIIMNVNKTMVMDTFTENINNAICMLTNYYRFY